jgi:hypothetical protein
MKRLFKFVNKIYFEYKNLGLFVFTSIDYNIYYITLKVYYNDNDNDGK